MTIQNVPSFALALDQSVAVAGLGTIDYDMAFGGNFYALVAADTLGLDPVPENAQQLIDSGLHIIHAIEAAASASRARA